jgi:lipopolysaccharide transport system permease protein
MNNTERTPIGIAVAAKAENAAAIPDNLPRTRRSPSKGWAWPKFRELWEYRELLFFFVWRDIKVRYRQTVMGALWAIIQPLSHL